MPTNRLLTIKNRVSNFHFSKNLIRTVKQTKAPFRFENFSKPNGRIKRPLNQLTSPASAAKTGPLQNRRLFIKKKKTLKRTREIRAFFLLRKLRVSRFLSYNIRRCLTHTNHCRFYRKASPFPKDTTRSQNAIWKGCRSISTERTQKDPSAIRTHRYVVVNGTCPAFFKAVSLLSTAQPPLFEQNSVFTTLYKTHPLLRCPHDTLQHHPFQIQTDINLLISLTLLCFFSSQQVRTSRRFAFFKITLYNVTDTVCPRCISLVRLALTFQTIRQKTVRDDSRHPFVRADLLVLSVSFRMTEATASLWKEKVLTLVGEQVETSR